MGLPTEDRAHLLSAFAAIPIIGEPFVLFVAYAEIAEHLIFVTLMREDESPRLRNLPAVVIMKTLVASTPHITMGGRAHIITSPMALLVLIVIVASSREQV